MNNSGKIDPYGFREYDARWVYEKDIDDDGIVQLGKGPVSYTHLRAHETR